MEAGSNRSLTGCEGCTEQWCSRHGIAKGKTHRHLCATEQRYFDMWEAGISRGQKKSPVDSEVAKQRELIQQRRDELTRQLWAELHFKTDATAEWFANWLKRVPSYGCKCRDAFEAIIKVNPPRFDDWFAWTVEVHNAVNRKLGRKEWTLDEAVARWATAFTE